jgi:hypothetical protein
VHFGNTSEGGSLDKVQLTISSDTFVSACVNEIGYNRSEVEWFLESLRLGYIKISSLFPFKNLSQELELFVPRPIYVGHRKYDAITNTSLLQEQVKQQKKIKKIGYVRASNLYNESGQYSPSGVTDEPIFGQFLTSQRVALREDNSKPYVVGSFKFVHDAGLYCILGVKNEEDIERVKAIFESLSYTGIGGKRSSGYGQFMLEDEFELDELPLCGDDDAALYHLLHQEGPIYMSVSSITPKVDEIETLSQGTYKLMRRSGFVYSESIVAPCKRNSFYALQEGSCMPVQLEGQVIELCHDQSPHPIYKYMKGFWLGVNVGE